MLICFSSSVCLFLWAFSSSLPLYQHLFFSFSLSLSILSLELEWSWLLKHTHTHICTNLHTHQCPCVAVLFSDITEIPRDVGLEPDVLSIQCWLLHTNTNTQFRYFNPVILHSMTGLVFWTQGGLHAQRLSYLVECKSHFRRYGPYTLLVPLKTVNRVLLQLNSGVRSATCENETTSWLGIR